MWCFAVERLLWLSVAPQYPPCFACSPRHHIIHPNRIRWTHPTINSLHGYLHNSNNSSNDHKLENPFMRTNHVCIHRSVSHCVCLVIAHRSYERNGEPIGVRSPTNVPVHVAT